MKNFKYIDHLAYVFHTLDDGYEFFKNFPGFKILKGPGINKSQGVNYLFISINDSSNIEILSPASVNSPINNKLKKSGPGLYHYCYAVDNIKDTIDELIKNQSWILIQEPISDIAFDGRKIAFLQNKKFGIIELVEAIPQDLEICKTEINLKSKISNIAIKDNKNKNLKTKQVSKLPEPIKEILFNLLDDDTNIPDEINSFDEIPEWDSLSNVLFHSQFEELINEKLRISDQTMSLETYINIFIAKFKK